MNDKKYIIEVTKEQLKLISDACELSSRLRSGQLHEIGSILGELIEYKKNDEIYDAINELKRIIGLNPGESFGIRESTKTAKNLYEIYYMIKHFFACRDESRINVYKNKLLSVANNFKIIIHEHRSTKD